MGLAMPSPSPPPISSDVIANLFALKYAKSQTSLATLLPSISSPYTPAASNTTQSHSGISMKSGNEEGDPDWGSHTTDDFSGGLGYIPSIDDSTDPRSQTASASANETLRRRMLGKQSRHVPPSRNARQALSAMKGSLTSSNKSKTIPSTRPSAADSDDDDDESRSKIARKRQRQTRQEPKEDQSQSTKKRPSSYLDQVLAERASKKNKKAQKKQSTDKTGAVE